MRFAEREAASYPLAGRRDFIGMMAGVAGFFSAPLRSWAATQALAPLNIRRYEVKVGLDKPFSALHISDTHLAYCDRRENARKVDLAMRRYSEMRHAEHYLDESLRYSMRDSLRDGEGPVPTSAERRTTSLVRTPVSLTCSGRM